MPIPLPVAAVPACTAGQLHLSIDHGDGGLAGMSHDGVTLAILNRGRDCLLPALPAIALRDRAGHRVPAVRRVPVGMHPGPVMVPVRLGGGHHATTTLRWVSGPVFPANRRVRVRSVTVRIGAGGVRTALDATLYGPVGEPARFDQSPLRAVEGMAAG